MEISTENVDESMKNSSAFTAPTSVGAAVSAERPAPAIVPGLTCEGGNSCGVAHGDDDQLDGFTLVTRSKRRLGKAPKEAASGAPFPPLLSNPSDSATGTACGAEGSNLAELTGNFVDPFGLSQVSPQDNPVTWARTKQSVRQHTAGSAGSSSIIRGRLSPRRFVVKAAGPKKTSPRKTSRTLPSQDEDGWETSGATGRSRRRWRRQHSCQRSLGVRERANDARRDSPERCPCS